MVISLFQKMYLKPKPTTVVASTKDVRLSVSLCPLCVQVLLMDCYRCGSEYEHDEEVSIQTVSVAEQLVVDGFMDEILL